MKHLIIGGVAGGATAAARIRRLDEAAEIIIIERGAHISYANCGLPYYIGGLIQERERLFLQTPTGFGNRFNADVRVGQEVMSINTKEKEVSIRELCSGRMYAESYDKLLLSPGAEPVRPPIEGVDLEGIFTLRNVRDTDAIKSTATALLARATGGRGGTAPRAVVVGAGFIGLEMVENLRHLGMEVTLIEADNQVMPPIDYDLACQVQMHLREKGVTLLLSAMVCGFSSIDNKKTEDSKAFRELSVLLESGNTLRADMVILSVGVRPDTALARQAGLKIGPTGGIWVNEYMQTSAADVYAVGDAVEFPHPITGVPALCFLAGPANKQARMCADNMVCGHKKKYEGSIRTAVAKVFDLTAGSAGLSERQLNVLKYPYQSALVHAASHAGYYPGAKNVSIKIHFSTAGGRLLGGQVVGGNGADKRLDLLSETIRRGGTVYDLTCIEHAYAPPYSSAKDPVILAACVAENILLDRMYAVSWDALAVEDPLSFTLLDVRSLEEYRQGALPEALHIPVDELRERLDELPTDKKIVVYCAVGQRGHVASRILLQSGFSEVYNLSGGFATAACILRERAFAHRVSV